MGMLDNFKVIEITKATEPACVIFEDNKMRFTKAVAIELGNPQFVRLLMDADGKRIAIQVAKGNESNVIKFVQEKDKEPNNKSVIYQNVVIVDMIRTMMPSWEKGKKYFVKGVVSREDKAIVFNLKTGEQYTRFTKKTEGDDAAE